MTCYFKNLSNEEDSDRIGGIATTAIVGTCFSLVPLIVSIINFRRVIAATSALEAWSGVDGCVEDDMYMRLSEVELTSIDAQSKHAKVGLALAVLASVVQFAMACTGCYLKPPKQEQE